MVENDLDASTDRVANGDRDAGSSPDHEAAATSKAHNKRGNEPTSGTPPNDTILRASQRRAGDFGATTRPYARAGATIRFLGGLFLAMILIFLFSLS